MTRRKIVIVITRYKIITTKTIYTMIQRRLKIFVRKCNNCAL